MQNKLNLSMARGVQLGAAVTLAVACSASTDQDQGGAAGAPVASAGAATGGKSSSAGAPSAAAGAPTLPGAGGSSGAPTTAGNGSSGAPAQAGAGTAAAPKSWKIGDRAGTLGVSSRPSLLQSEARTRSRRSWSKSACSVRTVKT